MTRGCLRVAIFLGAACLTAAADPPVVTIPALSPPPVIDGQPFDEFWQKALILRLTSSGPMPLGGESRVAISGHFLCLSARLPETDRVVAHSTGRNPTWWAEDLVTWNIRIYHTRLRRNLNLSLTVNPFGAYRLDGASGTALDADGKVLAASRVERGQWSVEAALPLDELGPIGFLDVRRVRAARPGAPELLSYWPAPNQRAAFQIAELADVAAPDFLPSTLGAAAAPLAVQSALSWIPRNAWSDDQRRSVQPTRMLANSLHHRMASIAEKEKQTWNRVDSRAAWEHFRDERLAALRNWLGPMPQRTPLHAETTGRVTPGKGFVIENVLYESRPGLVIAANLYLPESHPGRVPAIIVVHSHHAPRTQSELQDLGMTWARAGAAVLIPDQLCAGERIQSQPWPRESYYGRYTLGSQLLLAGESLMKWMVWDLMRSVDLLHERPDIDSKRIVMLGAVAGGGDPAAVTAALDPRIAAVIPFNFGEASPEDHYTTGPREYDSDTASPGWGEWETTRSLPLSAAGQFFPWLLCVAPAPRPFLYSFEVGWPGSVEDEPVWHRYQKVYELYDARDHLDQVHGFGPFPGPGECTNVGTFLRKQIYPILHRWLEVPVPADEYHDPLPDAALASLTPAAAAERQPQLASAIALRIAQERLQSSPGKKNLTTLRTALQAKLGDIEPLPNPHVATLWEKTSDGVSVEAFTLESEPGITLPVYILETAHAAPRMPAVIAVAQGGKAGFLAERADEIQKLLRDGIAVCLPDVRGAGELAEGSSRHPGAMDSAVTELMLGGTLPGAQLRDVRTVFRYLKSRPDIDPAGIALWGDSLAPPNPDGFAFDQSEMQEPGPVPQHNAEPLGPLLALLTGLYEDSATAVAVRGGLSSFLSVLEGRFSHVPEDAVIPGILEVGDIADIAEAQVPRPILLEKSVDGRNLIDRHPRLVSTSRVVVRDSAGTPDLPTWLSTHCRRRSN